MGEHRVGEWNVALVGDDADLRDASLMFQSEEIEVAQVEEEYFLRSSRFASITDAEEVMPVAINLLHPLNGVAKARSKSFEGLSLDYVVKRLPDGTHRIAKGIFTRTRVVPADENLLSDGTSIESSLESDAAKRVSAVGSDEVVSRILTIYGALGTDWRGLYMVMDAIQQDVGGEESLKQVGWVSKKAIQDFKKTANNYRALGLEARHGFRSEQEIKKPMSIGTARHLVRTLLNKWLAHKGL